MAGTRTLSQSLTVALPDEGATEALAASFADDLDKGSVIARLVGHGSPVLGLTLSRSGDVCVSASSDKTLRLWKVLWDTPRAPVCHVCCMI